MRIGFLTHQFPGVRSGGIGTYVLQAARVLAEAGHEAHIFTPALPADVRAGVPANVTLHEVADLATRVAEGGLPAELAAATESGGEAVYRLAIGWLLCEAAREFHAAELAAGRGGLDILETPEYEALGLPLLLQEHGERGGPRPFPVVTQLHLCSAIAREGNLGSVSGGRQETSDADALIDAFEFAAIALTDGLCAPTQTIATETRRISGIERTPVILQHPLRPAPGPAPLPENGPILFVGRLEPRKGTDLMPEAFSRFLLCNPDATIRLVGSDTQWGGGSVRHHILSAMMPGVRDRVIFAGEKSPAEVSREFAACRFSICPSLFESYGYVAAESLLAGRAVVVSSGIGATEIVGDAGLVFARGSAKQLAEAMEKLWRDRRLCAEASARARQRALELADPARAVGGRIGFYQKVRATWSAAPGKGAAGALACLRPEHAAAILQGLSALTGALAGVALPQSQTSGARLLSVMEKIAAETGAPARVLLYGAGRFTARLLAQKHLWEKQGHRVEGLIDDHPRFAGMGTHLGLPICNIAGLIARAEQGRISPIVLSTDSFQEQFWRQTELLRRRGVAVYRL